MRAKFHSTALQAAMDAQAAADAERAAADEAEARAREALEAEVAAAAAAAAAESEAAAAAVRIQSLARGQQDRRRVQVLRDEEAAAFAAAAADDTDEAGDAAAAGVPAADTAGEEVTAQEVDEDIGEDVEAYGEEEGAGVGEEDEGADIEEASYAKDIAALKIQALERGRRARRDQVMQGGAGAGAGSGDALRAAEGGEASSHVSRAADQDMAAARREEGTAAGAHVLAPAPEHGGGAAGEDVPALGSGGGVAVMEKAGGKTGEETETATETPRQARRRIVEARMARMPVPSAQTPPQSPAPVPGAEPAGAGAAAALSEPATPATPQSGEQAAGKKPKRLLKPLPAVSAPHNTPEVATQLMTERLGDEASVWKIEWKDLELKQRVGVGNFATVYKARHRREDCAVKCFTNQSMSSKEFAAFVNETAFLHRLRHPHICQVTNRVKSIWTSRECGY